MEEVESDNNWGGAAIPDLASPIYKKGATRKNTNSHIICIQ